MTALLAEPAFAAVPPGFDQWRDAFRARAQAKSISDATWTRVMGRMALMEEMLMITPACWVAICRPNTWQGSTVPNRRHFLRNFHKPCTSVASTRFGQTSSYPG